MEMDRFEGCQVKLKNKAFKFWNNQLNRQAITPEEVDIKVKTE